MCAEDSTLRRPRKGCWGRLLTNDDMVSDKHQLKLRPGALLQCVRDAKEPSIRNLPSSRPNYIFLHPSHSFLLALPFLTAAVQDTPVKAKLEWSRYLQTYPTACRWLALLVLGLIRSRLRPRVLRASLLYHTARAHRSVGDVSSKTTRQ